MQRRKVESRWSGRRLVRAMASLLLFLPLCTGMLAGCSPRPSANLLVPADRAPMFTPKARILVATTRERSKTDPDAFTANRAHALNYADITVSIPTRHHTGDIEWPDQTPPDPTRHFITVDRTGLEREQFFSAIRARFRAGGPEHDEVLIFVHGYNSLFQEAVYRFAQIVHDTGFKGTAILFAWPSRGSTPLYVADREASTYSRDYLEQLLVDLGAMGEVRSINIMAHSMGNWPVIEALRQARMKGHGSFNGKLAEVIMAAPDLDVGVFRTELDTIGKLPRPLTIMVSRDDNALALARTLAGGIDRVGSADLSDPRVVAAVKKYNLRVVDLTGVKSKDSTNHVKFAQSAVITEAIGRGLSSERRAGGLLNQGGVIQAVTDVGQSIVNVPSTIIGLPSLLQGLD